MNKTAVRESVLKVGALLLKTPTPDWKGTLKSQAGTWQLGLTTVQQFKQARLALPEGVITIIEANPAKVVHAESKVMVYFESENGQKRVGQVRKRGENSELVWFPVS